MKTDDIRQDGSDRLVALSDLKDYKVAKDNPDVAGWRVIGANGERLGMVKDLIVDLQAMKTRYLSVTADRKYFNTNDDQYLLIPIGAAALDKKNRQVFVSHLDANTIVNYPVYPGGPIREDYEYAVRDNFMQSRQHFVGGNQANTINPEPTYTETNRVNVTEQPVVSRPIQNEFYENQHYNENQFYTSNPTPVERDNTIIYSSSQDLNRNDNAVPPRTTVTPVSESRAGNVNTGDNNPKNVEEAIATIERLEQLRERGSLTDEEFRILKNKALNI